MTAGDTVVWVDLPFSDEPLDSVVLLADGKKGTEAWLELRDEDDERCVRVSAGSVRIETDGLVEAEISGDEHDDGIVRVDYYAAGLCLRGGRVGLDLVFSADDEDSAEFRAGAQEWIADGFSYELELPSHAEFRLGGGPDPGPTAPPGDSMVTR